MQEIGNEDKQDKPGERMLEHIQHIQLLEIILLQHPQIPRRQSHIQTPPKHILQSRHEERLRENLKRVNIIRLQS